LIALGRSEDRFQHIGQRLWGLIVYVFGQKRVINKPFGFNHFFIFWSFMILLFANAEFLINGIFPRISFALLGDGVYHGLIVLFVLCILLLH